MDTVIYPDYIDADLVERSLDGDVTEAWAIGYSISQEYDEEECLGQIFADLCRSEIVARNNYREFEQGVLDRSIAD